MSNIRHLKALQAFDSAASHSSLTKAAEELSVTQGAISRQIKLLEEYLGNTLLHRTPRGVVKTKAGEALHKSTNQAFSLLGERITSLQQPTNKESLTLSLTASLATKWLVPRLPAFRAKYPNIEIFLDTCDDIISFDHSQINAALRFATPPKDNLHWEHVANESLILVASPQLIGTVSASLPPDDILSLPRLVDDFDDRWEQWATVAGIANQTKKASSTIHFKDSTVMISSAINGQGIALVRKLLVADDVKTGLLIRLDNSEIALERSLNLVCRKRDRLNPNVVKLRDWLVSG